MNHAQRATVKAARGAFGPGVRIAPPSARARPEAGTMISMQPGVRWLAERMSVWRDHLGRRDARAIGRPWGSVEEAVGTLEHAVRPAIQRLAKELVALGEAATAVKEGEVMPEREAARFEAAIEYWRRVDASLRARSFPNDYECDRRLRAILHTLDDRLLRTLEAYMRLANHPWDAVHLADSGGMVSLEVNLDCNDAVRAFATWAETRSRSRRSSSGFWWLVAAFAVGYGLGDD